MQASTQKKVILFLVFFVVFFPPLRLDKWCLLPAPLSSIPGTSFPIFFCPSACFWGTAREQNTCQANSARGCRSCTLRGHFMLSLGTDVCGLVCSHSVPCFFLFLFSHAFLNQGCVLCFLSENAVCIAELLPVFRPVAEIVSAFTKIPVSSGVYRLNPSTCLQQELPE